MRALWVCAYVRSYMCVCVFYMFVYVCVCVRVCVCVYHSLSRSSAVAVALLVVGAMQRVPLHLLRVVGQYLLHGLQSSGDGALLQSAPFL